MIEIKDKKRQNKLESVGFKVLRYKDEDILHNIHSVITDIKNIIKEMVK